MTSFTKRIKPDSTELERYFLSVYTGNLWDALEKIKDWHSPEHIEKEVQMKLLKLQQQALPVVKDFVAEWIECVKGKSKNALALLDDDDMPDDVNEWLFFQRNDDNINLILRAWLDGYTVEKPQLFYLKHIDMSKADKECDYFAQIRNDRFEHESVQNNTLPGVEVVGVRFTQAEIDSMQIGSYEQIEVTE